ncbi:MAG: hypothetical protein JSU65_11945 [Candidatus Zixiibacteriota bacterium]|nr:MAG: hypothetical protein JSU65_11945 [candidate division Zixibacteria bacterium]
MIRRTIWLAAAAGLLAGLIGCEDRGVVRISPVGAIEIPFGETVTIQQLGIELTFTDVNDVRCPANMTCFWEGMAEVYLQLVELPADTHFVILPLGRGSTWVGPVDYMPVDTLGLHMILTQLTPYPVIPLPEDSFYRAKILISAPEDPDPDDGDIELTKLPHEYIPVDGFWLDSVYITDNMLNVLVTYSGGCRNHYFWLYMSPDSFDVSHPGEADLYLRHFNNSDVCDAIVHDSLRFDLTNLIEKNQEQFGEEHPIQLNLHGDTATPQIMKTTYFPESWPPSPMMPMAVGNYWVYQDSAWIWDHWEESIDTVEVLGTHTDGCGDWWVLSRSLVGLTDTIMVIGDTIHSRQYGLGGLMPSLEFIPAVGDSSYTYDVIRGCIAHQRTVSFMHDPVEVPAGRWIGTYHYDDGCCVGPRFRAIIAPGVGIVYAEREALSPFWPGPLSRTRLLEYNLKE